MQHPLPTRSLHLRGLLRGRLCVFLALAVALAVATACGAPDGPEILRIGVLDALATPQGLASIEVAELVAEQINAEGGLTIGGKRYAIEIFPADTGDMIWKAVEEARRLIYRENVAVLIGPSASREAIPVGQVAEDAGALMISPTSTNPRTTRGRRWVFRVPYTEPDQAAALAHYVIEELGLETAAALYDAHDDYSRDLALAFEQAFEAAGGRFLAAETHPPDQTTDWRPQLERLRAAAPQVLFLSGYHSKILPQARQARELGIQAQFIGGDGWLTDFIEGHPEVEGGVYCQHWHVDMVDQSPTSRAFYDAFSAHFQRPPFSRAALVYDAFGLYFDAVRRADSVVGEKVRDALADTVDFMGVTGTITYRGRGGDPRKDVVILRLENGRSELVAAVSPEDLRHGAETSSEDSDR